jgi:hypothetical protein
MVTWIPSIYPSHVSIDIPAPWILLVGVAPWLKTETSIIAIDGLCGALCPSALGRKLLSLPGGTERKERRGRAWKGDWLLGERWFMVAGFLFFFVPM